MNYCIKALIEKGYVKAENFHNSKNKFKYGYVLTPTGNTQKIALTGQFLHRKLEVYKGLKKEIYLLRLKWPNPTRVEMITRLFENINIARRLQ